MRRIRQRLTYANVMSSIAVFLVLGGVAVAAAELPRNSVGAKQLKKNAVTGAKVKDQSLTGKDINLSKLGVVPAASHAVAADSIPAAEAAHLVGAPGQPAFQAGSGNYGAAGLFKLQSVGFYKDREGIVHLQGLAKVGTTGPITGVLFFLPPGYRPASGLFLFFNVFCVSESKKCTEDSGGATETYGRMLIIGSNVSEGSTALDGAVIVPSGTAVSLDGITFRAES